MQSRHLLLAIAAIVWLSASAGLATAADGFTDSISGGNATSPPTDRPPLKLARPEASRASSANAAGTGTAGDIARPTRANADWWTTLGGLSLLAIVIVVCARFLRRWLPRTPGLLPEQALETLGRFPVDPRNNIYLVRVGSRLLVLSSTTDGLRTLSEITDISEVSSLMRLCSDDGTTHGTEYSATPSASQRLQARLRKSASRTSAPETAPTASREVPHG